MKSDLFKFLFDTSQAEALAESIVEETKEVESLKITSKPLIAALKEIGIDITYDSLVFDGEGVSLELTDDASHSVVLSRINQPENTAKLAELNWIAAPAGEHSGTNNLRIYFLQLDEPTGDGTKNDHKEVDLDELIGKAQELGDQPDKDQAKERKENEKLGESAADLVSKLLKPSVRDAMLDDGWMQDGDLWISPDSGELLSFEQARHAYLHPEEAED